MHRLDQEVAKLVAALEGWQATATWKSIRIAEAAEVRHRRNSVQIPRRILRSPEEYAARFEHHLRAGFSWINLSAAGIIEGTLIVLIETPHRSSGTPAEHVAVNLSGPMAGVGVELTDEGGLAPFAADILRACDDWQAGTIDLQALEKRLEDLSSQLDLPAAVRQEVIAWSRQLAAAREWSASGDPRGPGRAEGIVTALRAWASGLPWTEAPQQPA